MKCRMPAKILLASLTVLSLALSALAEDAPVSDVGTFDKATAEKVFPAKRAYSPWAGRNFPSRPLFGDTHLHTALTPAPLAHGCCRAMRIASPRVKKSVLRQVNRRSCRVRSTFLSSPITLTIWASFPIFLRASPNS